MLVRRDGVMALLLATLLTVGRSVDDSTTLLMESFAADASWPGTKTFKASVRPGSTPQYVDPHSRAAAAAWSAL